MRTNTLRVILALAAVTTSSVTTRAFVHWDRWRPAPQTLVTTLFPHAAGETPALPVSSQLTFAGGQKSSGLEGTSWQLVKLQGPDDMTNVPDDKSKYTIRFGRDG